VNLSPNSARSSARQPASTTWRARGFAFAFSAAALVHASVCPMNAAEPTLILHHGRIATCDAQFSIHAALAVDGEKIRQTGSNEEILALRGPGTQLVDLGGRLVIPGLIDSHTHPVSACLTEFDHPIPDMETIEAVLDYLRQRTKIVPEGDWIVLQQVFITRLREQRYPTRAELDQVAPRHPVMFRTGPDASLNSLALRRSGIDRNFKVDDGGSGFAEKDPATGEPTGILRNCTRYVKANLAVKTPTPQEHETRLRQLFADYNSVGITTICDRDASLEGLERYAALRDAKALSVRVRCSQDIGSIGPIEKIENQIRSVARHPLFTAHDPWLRIIGIKTFLDGGMLTGSAYLREPWGVSAIYGITDPAYRGVLFIPHDRLLPMVRAAVESGLQFTAHSVGDGAVHALLEVYDELSQAGLPIRATHCSVTHSNFMSKEAVAQAARLGVMLDIQPIWLHMDAHTLIKQFGYERLRWFQPLRSVFEAGAIAGGGSDHMQKIGSLRSINPYNPFLGIATAVTRRARGEENPLHPEEGLSREQALRFYTLNNAKVLRSEDEIGSLEPGKFADLAILSTDLLTCPPEKIAACEVFRTYLRGEVVYSNEPRVAVHH
jgi:predicted amidohydrolase YtcJ